VAQAAARLKEAQKLGFQRAVVPEVAQDAADPGLAFTPVGSLVTLVSEIAARGDKERRVEREPGFDD
jgi:DNA repair protein RadA/Sms